MKPHCRPHRTRAQTRRTPSANTANGAGFSPCIKIPAVSAPLSPTLADRLDRVLPQTQCRRCGYEGCRPYAEAIADGEAINRCPPGADAVIATLAALTGRPVVPLDRSCGDPGPLMIARIDETSCIGCRLCIDACPVDAIVGAAKRMHTVLPALCTGCDLCIPACPVDCIAMIPAGRLWSPHDGSAARERYLARNRRLAGAAVAPKAPAKSPPPESTRADRQAAAAAALARARARRAAADARTK
jgi:Na+-translocating ferredoxin:NAD+ oxidoreductase subunit B